MITDCQLIVINSDHSKIKLDTKNVFIEITATDPTKLEIVNQILVAMFAGTLNYLKVIIWTLIPYFQATRSQ